MSEQGDPVMPTSMRGEPIMRKTILDLQKMKSAGERIVMLTAYDAPSAIIAERAGVPALLIGDSLGMVVHGHSSTLPVTLDDMVRHAAAVSRGSRHALLVADLPFLTYGTEADAVASARRLMQEGQVQAVKIEGGQAMAAIVARLCACGVPVMGHLGFTPQAQHQIGLRVQGKDVAGARRLLQDALALQAAGAFAVVLELVPAPLAEAISRRLSIPTIGIGAGAGCDGEVQVWHDVLGLFEGGSPRHAKRYAEIGAAMTEAIRAFVLEVQSGTFPTRAQSADMDPAILAEALADI
jgi:3-methyl-2-oxobutanoate hydroxymethyltransferase